MSAEAQQRTRFKQEDNADCTHSINAVKINKSPNPTDDEQKQCSLSHNSLYSSKHKETSNEQGNAKQPQEEANSNEQGQKLTRSQRGVLRHLPRNR